MFIGAEDAATIPALQSGKAAPPGRAGCSINRGGIS
jgi:hypothetical protein